MALVAHRLHDVIAAQERHRAAHGFQVVAAPARGARVDQHPGMAAAQLVPVRQVAADVVVLGDPLAVLGVVLPPQVQRVDVEVLAVEVDALRGDELVDVVGQPLAGLGVAEVEQAAVGAAEDPLGVVFGQPRAAVDALRLEPHDRPDALGAGMVRDLPQASGEAVGVHLPCAGLAPAPIAPVPAGIHPPVVQRQLLLEVAVHEQHLARAVGVDHLAELVRAARGHLDRGQLAAGAWQVVGQHPAPPDVLRADPVAVPELERHQRRADLLARVQPQVRPFLPGDDAQARGVVAAELGGPLPGPAHDHDQALARPRDVEVGQVAVARSSARGGDAG